MPEEFEFCLKADCGSGKQNLKGFDAAVIENKITYIYVKKYIYNFDEF